jgi:hypothetical protein
MRIHPNETWLETLTGQQLLDLQHEAEVLGPRYLAAYREQLTRLVLLQRLPQ